MDNASARRRRKERKAGRRAAWHADKWQKADGPAGRMRTACEWLTSEVAHAERPAAEARRVRDEVVGHVRLVTEEAGITGAALELQRTQLARHGPDVQRLSTALMCLRSAIARLPAADRDDRYEHYATELRREAQELAQKEVT